MYSQSYKDIERYHKSTRAAIAIKQNTETPEKKARRKERDDQNSTDTKLYLEESVLERKLPDADLKALVDFQLDWILMNG
uniref:Uncharacterized protein n=1 Tax=Megaselia scalaris TaxID=36166 RepID=T1GWK3_MEGSC